MADWCGVQVRGIIAITSAHAPILERLAALLAKKVFVASAVLSAGRMLIRFLDILAALIVARFLTPADFGIVALAAAALGVTRAMTELPVSEALIRAPDVTRADIDTAFTLSVLRGFLITCLLALAAWPLAWIYGDERLINLTLVLAVAPCVAGLRSPQLLYFERSVNFTPTIAIEAAAKTVAFVVSVLCAYFTRSYWALVIALVLPPILATPASFIAAPYRPRFDLSRSRPILSYAGWVTLSRLLATLNSEADRFFVGGILGSAPVAFWAMGRSLAFTVSWAIGVPLMPALFSALSQAQHDRARLVSAYLQAQGMLFACIVPIAVSAGVLARPLVHLALGPQWAPVAPMIQFLAPAGGLVAIAMPIQSTMLALNRPRELVLRDTLMLVIGLPSLVLGAWWGGLMGAVYVRTFTAILDALINAQMLRVALGVSVARQMLNPWRSGVSVLAMAAVMVGVEAMLSAEPGFRNDIHLIAVVGSIGMLTYVSVHTGLWVLTGRPHGPERMIRNGAARFAL